MLSRLRLARPSPAMAVALLALFVALGGGAYAAFNLPPNSVTGPKVKDGSLRPQDLKTIIARPHGNGDVATGTSAAPASYPLAKAKWKQAKGEVEQVDATVTYRTPASCGGFAAINGGILYVNGTNEGFAGFASSPPNQTLQTTASFPVPVAASKRSNTLSMKAYDSCSGGSENITVKSVSADVLAFR